MSTNSLLLRAVQVFVFLIVLTGAVACTSSSQSPTIFADQLGEGWEDWSWDCACNFRSTSETHDDSRYVIAVDLSAWGGLGIGRHSPVSTSGFDQLQFYIHGGDAGGQQLRISLEDKSGHELPAPLYLKDGQIHAGVWQRVTIPLEDLGAVDVRITKVNIMDGSGGRQPTFYIDDIALASNNTKSEGKE
jgi:hypothetical protein